MDQNVYTLEASQIIENNGILFQMYSKLSLDFYEEQTPNITFN